MVFIARTVLAAFLLALATGAWASLPIPAPPSVNAKGYYVVEHHSGDPLAALKPDERLEPASITKLMTAYIAFDRLADGALALNEAVTVSEKAWRTPGSRMFIEVGTTVTVEDLLKGMIIQSGNDASVAIAERIAGTEETFAALMNEYARDLGMTGTNYENSTGLPGPNHYTTARDIATLARHIIDRFPQYYSWYSEKEYTYNGITQHNRNTLLWRDPTVDGIKTGHTDAAGYCLVSSAKRGDMRLVAVVLGTPSQKSRTEVSQALLNYGFNFFETHKLYGAGEQISSQRVWKGTQEAAALGLKEDVFITIPRGRYSELEAAMDVRATLLAPLSVSDEVGTVRVRLGEELLLERALYPLEPVPEGSLWRRAVDQVMLWFE